MKLTDLNPRWCAEAGAPEGTKQGIGFDCPHCRKIRLAIFFDPPIEGRIPDIKAVQQSQADGHLDDHHIGRILWRRAGDTFENLSLSPSIDASAFGHWHGYITDGEIR
jgi:hypothetical protein